MVHSRSERDAPEAGTCWFTPNLEDDLGRFIQDVNNVFVVDNFVAVVVEATNAYQVVLESWYDVSALYG